MDIKVAAWKKAGGNQLQSGNLLTKLKSMPIRIMTSETNTCSMYISSFLLLIGYRRNPSI
jgi:hypothetical protein